MYGIQGQAHTQFWLGRPEGKKSLGRPTSRWEDNIKMNLQEAEWGHGVD